VETEEPRRSSQFGILDFLLLTAGCAYALAVLIPAAPRDPVARLIAIAVATGMTLLGSVISYPIWRFLLRKRFTVFAVNHLGYLLVVVVLGLIWDDEIFRIAGTLVCGPLLYINFANALWAGPFIISFLALPMIVLMGAHTFRPNLLGVMLTSLGCALWYLSACGALLTRMP
jgi:hypothetical protein